MKRTGALKPRQKTPGRHAPGIAPHRDGWRVYVRVQGVYRSKLFPGDTEPQTLVDERDALRVDVRRELERGAAPANPLAEPFDQATERYLAAVTSMPTYAERERDIGLWVAEFGKRTRGSITTAEIRAVRDRWRQHGPRMVQQRAQGKRKSGTRRAVTWKAVPGPLAASTVNHRVRALANLWTVLDGRHAPNAAREVPDLDEPDDVPRAIPADIVERILAALPDRGVARKKGQLRPTVSLSKARLVVMTWTGMPPAQIKKLRREDVDWKASTIVVPSRRKGKGVASAKRPVTSRGLEALRALDAAGAWGPFWESTVLRAWRRACAAVERQLASEKVTVDLSRLRPYDLRHTVAAATLAATGDLAATQALIGHNDQRTTLRYARAAIPGWLAEAAAKLDAAQQPAKPEPPKQAKKPAKGRGRKLRRKLRTSRKVAKR